jgi:hypothetical protein
LTLLWAKTFLGLEKYERTNEQQAILLDEGAGIQFHFFIFPFSFSLFCLKSELLQNTRGSVSLGNYKLNEACCPPVFFWGGGNKRRCLSNRIADATKVGWQIYYVLGKKETT